MRKLRKADVFAVASRRPAGYVEAVLSKAVRDDGQFLLLTTQSYDFLQQEFNPEAYQARRARLLAGERNGAGTELKKLLAKFGITATDNCRCNRRAGVMDRNGWEWCRDNVDTIVGWLREEAQARGVLFFDIVGRALVYRAIANARRLQRS